MKLSQNMRKLNMLLTLLGLTALYFFLQNRIDDSFEIPMIIGFGIVAIVSVIYGFRPIPERENGDEDKKE
ncbi:MAG TPA: hypothetical protein K8V35_01910 [Aliicoccus persicus]|uniref:Uncharacterized protein n=1 Tax=Aliicoccus persicus TaxID=930138 RepID=A0A921DWL7_9STAP|nr:hypothetical protein [Aliicoccus persicus]